MLVKIYCWCINGSDSYTQEKIFIYCVVLDFIPSRKVPRFRELYFVEHVSNVLYVRCHDEKTHYRYYSIRFHIKRAVNTRNDRYDA